MQEQDMKFPKYHKAYTTSFKFVSKFLFKFQDIAGKTQRKRLKVNIREKKIARNDNKTQTIFRLKYSQTCSNDHLYKTTTCLRRPMMSLPKPIFIQSLLTV